MGGGDREGRGRSFVRILPQELNATCLAKLPRRQVQIDYFPSWRTGQRQEAGPEARSEERPEAEPERGEGGAFCLYHYYSLLSTTIKQVIWQYRYGVIFLFFLSYLKENNNDIDKRLLPC